MARRLGESLKGLEFARVFSSPLIRAWRTCGIAGFGERAERDPDLMEWNYGSYEGLTTREIKSKNPNWDLFRDGCPGGESVAEITARADRALARIRSSPGPVLVFSSGHFLRVLAVRWCGLDATYARHLLLDTGTLSILGYAHGEASEPAIKIWNRPS